MLITYSPASLFLVHLLYNWQIIYLLAGENIQQNNMIYYAVDPNPTVTENISDSLTSVTGMEPQGINLQRFKKFSGYIPAVHFVTLIWEWF